ncbi:MAG: alpha/beta hydrolase [Pirellulales bacterium]
MRRVLVTIFTLIAMQCAGELLQGQELLNVWPRNAPGETSRLVGEKAPAVAGENPPSTRIINITSPTLSVHIPAHPTGTGVVILPGGGFSKVVTDKEGTEAAAWLNELGITAFVLSYRTKASASDNGWARPLQDAQRAVSLVRSQAATLHLKPDRIGILGFSAGGQVAARLLCERDKRSYEAVDEVDQVSMRPDFALLIYPWNLYDEKAGQLIEELKIPADSPPAFLVHTDDDRSSSLGTVLFYAGLKKLKIPAELHVYGNGGHGYGLRDITGSRISTWPDHAASWLKNHGF